MRIPVRSMVRRLLVLVLVLGALGVGYAARGGDATKVAAPTRHAKKLGLADMILIASSGTGLHLRITGITTGPPTPDHANDIPIDSFQFGTGRSIGSPVGGTRSVSAPNVSEVTLSRQADIWTIKLLNSALRGTATATTPTASIYFTDTSGPAGAFNDDLRVDLKQTLLSSYSASSGGGSPSESLSLNFTNITFTAHIPAGTTQTVTYDLTTQT